MVTHPTQRRYDLDWLRAFAFGGVFLYHCLRFFNSDDWEIKNAETSGIVDIFTGIFDLFGMPLLFAIAGASIFFALRPGGAQRFLRDRVKRLLVPLAFGIIVLGPPQVYLQRLTHGAFSGSFWQFLSLYFNGTLEHFAWTGVHLWFLEYLFLFTVVLTPIFLWLKRASGQSALASLSRFSVRPGAIFSWALVFVAVLISLDPFGLLRPEPSEPLVRLIFVVFVLIGYLIFADPGIQDAIIRQRRAALALALVLTPAPPLFTLGLEQWGWAVNSLSYALLMAAAGMLMWAYLLAIFGYGMRYLKVDRPLLAYANEAVLPIYILHQPVILLIGYFVVQTPFSIAVKFLIITPLAFVLTLGLYEYGVKRVGLLRFLFGLKPHGAAAAASASPLSPAQAA